jgi:hypothetical protein
MVKITLEHQPVSFLKYTRTFQGAFPSSYDELSPAQFIAIARLVNTTISETDFLKIMTGFPEFRINRLQDYYRYQLMLLFEPFAEIKPYPAFIIPNIKIKGKILCSPNPRFVRMTFAQFIFADSYFTSYQTEKKDTDLYKFVASLYLPELQPFSEDKTESFILPIARVNPLILDAVVINYVLVKEWLALAYPMVFQCEEEHDENNEPRNNKIANNPNHNSGWIKIYESIVGDDLVNHDRYGLIPLHNLLRWMTQKIKENMKRK